MNRSVFIFAALLAIASCSVFDFLRHHAHNSHDTNSIFLNETYHTGFVPLDTRGELFYWLFESRGTPSTDPLIIWLTGGPGCSSELAVLKENGPYRLDTNTNSLIINPYSWNNNANVIYIDQPIGTGFSKGSPYDVNEQQVSADFYTFLQGFLKANPQYEGRDFYVTGESYAGHYIPAVSSYILQTGGLNLNFKGVAIGNGLISAYDQYPAYATFAYENNLVNEQEYQSLQAGFAVCDKLIKSGHPQLANYECQTQFQRITGNPPRFNLYDIKIPCVTSLCYDFSPVTDFFNQPAVESALGVSGKWKVCNDNVNEALSAGDWLTDLTPDLSTLVTKGLKVLLYHGDLDFICNWRGGEVVANNLNWSGNSQFAGMNYTQYDTFGEYKQLDNLVFLRVYNAGHMVPMDQPLAALSMLNRFIAGW